MAGNVRIREEDGKSGVFFSLYVLSTNVQYHVLSPFLFLHWRYGSDLDCKISGQWGNISRLNVTTSQRVNRRGRLGLRPKGAGY
ncbi:hypothetical protein BVC80_1553g15 [Macleaya cordata]|uniref:Uncharacterized protein n=1 Tax=Macleaya cordata TaxID=56857 RepID=A0A200QY62_MACCD|nr:hypothetical protein BVC80_1553g15 [Macleaya cordata]